MNRRTLSALAALLVALGTFLGTILADDTTIVQTQTETQAATPPAVIAVDGADKDAKADDPVELTDEAQDVATDFAEQPADLEPEGLRGEDSGPVAKLESPYAADSLPGCRTRFLTTNWSGRGGVTPRAFGLHFTAGPDRPGSRADVDGLTAYGNNPAARVSWHINMDKDGNCDYNVPLRYKAWTIGDANPGTINIEVHGRGEAPYLRSAGYRKLARVYIAIRKAYPDIKLRVGALNNCNVTRGGFVTHWMGGTCSGGHTDIRPHEIEQVVATLTTYVRALGCGQRCRQLRAKHRRTHDLFRKNRCRGKLEPRYGYCIKLRARNKATHTEARRARIALR